MNGKKAKALRSMAAGTDALDYKEKIFKKVMKTVTGTEINYTTRTLSLNAKTKRHDYKMLKKAYVAHELQI